MLQGLRHQCDDLDRLDFVDALTLDNAVVDGLPVHIFHHEVVLIARSSDVVGTDDVGMVLLGRRPAFLVEPIDEVLVGRELLRQHLDGDQAVQAQLPG